MKTVITMIKNFRLLLVGVALLTGGAAWSQTQVLAIEAIAGKSVGDADFIPYVTNTAPLPVTVTTSTPSVCTATNSSVRLLTAGTCTILADAAASGTYTAAVQQTASFTVAATRTVQVYYVHADQIGTPRQVTRASDNALVWRWDNEEAFGDNQASEKPGAAERFAYNLRFAGQVYDPETGSSYNYFRDYDPATGRYQQSDPIGLEGGINTYGYVGGDPLGSTDSKGLFIDIVADAVFVGYDLYRLVADGACNREENLKALALDVLGMVTPGGTGFGQAYRVAKAAPGKVPVVSIGSNLAAKGAVINAQKQAGHIPDTPQNINRIKQGKPTSSFHGEQSGEMATRIANERGTPVPGRPNVKEHDFGVGVGTGPNGGTQTRVRVHESPKTGEIHGHPSGPERF